jgi:ribosomal protein L11 methyltransferase
MSGARESEWVEIEVAVRDPEAADVAGVLSTTVTGADAGVELRPPGIVFWVPRRFGERALREVRAALSSLATGGIPVDANRVRLRLAAPEAEWRDAWKRHFRATRVSPHIVIVPSWDTYTPVPGDVVLAIDPGRAFGTGAHASTRLCLVELDALAAAYAGAEPTAIHRFLDVGTGSGILSVAAAKLWPASGGLAIDTDPVAVEVATENVQRNQVAARVTCATMPIEVIDERFDLVIANIQADVLLSLRDAVLRSVASAGTLILSGLLSDGVEEVAREYTLAPGLKRVRVRRLADDPEWSAVVFQRGGA